MVVIKRLIYEFNKLNKIWNREYQKLNKIIITILTIIWIIINRILLTIRKKLTIIIINKNFWIINKKFWIRKRRIIANYLKWNKFKRWYFIKILITWIRSYLIEKKKLSKFLKKIIEKELNK